MKTKTCTKCTDPKPLSQFPWKNQAKGKRASICKLCMAAASKAWAKANRKHHNANVQQRRLELRADLYAKKEAYLLEHPCVDCKEPDPIVLDFDHEEPSKKTESVSVMIRSCISWETILKEIAKCSVRCANCHRRRTHKQRLEGTAGIQPASSA